MESPEDKSFAHLHYPQMRQVLRKLSNAEAARSAVNSAFSALRNFASVFKISLGEFEIGVEPTPGTADSGDLELDLTEMFGLIGQAAEDAGRGWALLVDEVQYLEEKDLAAITVAVHWASQKSLPVFVVAAGLPQVARLAGEAKSYAEAAVCVPADRSLGQKRCHCSHARSD